MPVMSHHFAIWSFLPFHYCCQPIPAPFPSIFQTTASLVSVHTSPSIKSYHQPETTLSLNTIPSSTQTTSCPPFHAFPHLVHNWFDSKNTCVKYVLSSQTIQKSIQIFSVLLVPSPTHLYYILPRFQPVSTPLLPVQVHAASFTNSLRLVHPSRVMRQSCLWIRPPANNPCSSLPGALIFFE